MIAYGDPTLMGFAISAGASWAMTVAHCPRPWAACGGGHRLPTAIGRGTQTRARDMSAEHVGRGREGCVPLNRAALVGEASAAVAMVNGPWFGAALDVGHRQRAASGRTVRTRACAMSYGHGGSGLVQRVFVQRAVC